MSLFSIFIIHVYSFICISEILEKEDAFANVLVTQTDDPNMPVLTFRMWVLGISYCL